MALAAAAIALFCVLARRGRVLAVIPAAAAVAVWLTSPQAVVYIANDGAVFGHRRRRGLNSRIGAQRTGAIP